MSSPSATPQSYLRLFHASCQKGSYDCYLDENLYAKDLLYKDFTFYTPLESGEHLITLCPHKSKEVCFSRTIELSKHKIYTLVLTGNPDNLSMHLLLEPAKPIPEAQLLLRISNFAQPLDGIKAHFKEATSYFKKLPFENATNYLAFDPTATAYTFELLGDDPDKPLFTMTPQLLKVSRYYTLYLLPSSKPSTKLGTKLGTLETCLTIDGHSFLDC